MPVAALLTRPPVFWEACLGARIPYGGLGRPGCSQQRQLWRCLAGWAARSSAIHRVVSAQSGSLKPAEAARSSLTPGHAPAAATEQMPQFNYDLQLSSALPGSKLAA